MSKTFRFRLAGSSNPLICKGKSELEKHGVTVKGDDNSGNFKGKLLVGKIVGSYKMDNDYINITVIKKPVFATWGIIESQITNFIDGNNSK